MTAAGSSADFDNPYEGSDESSESELLDQSLSVWRGFTSFDAGGDFVPVPLDLHTASSIGHCDCVRAIIQKGGEDLDRKNQGGWTALMYACYIGHDPVVGMLLGAQGGGVAVNAVNNAGLTPLMLAASCGNVGVAYLLLQQGAKLEAQDKRGWTALFHATYSGHQNMVRFLIDNHADINAVEPERGLTPLMEAAAAGHEIIVQYFLEHGVNVSARSTSGDTARSLALVNGHTKIVGLIDNYVARAAAHSAPLVGGVSVSGMGVRRDSSSSDESSVRNNNHRPPKGKSKGLSIEDGPKALDRLLQTAGHQPANNSLDADDDGDAFSKETGAVTIRSSPNTSGAGGGGGLVGAIFGGARGGSSPQNDGVSDRGGAGGLQQGIGGDRDKKQLEGVASGSHSPSKMAANPYSSLHPHHPPPSGVPPPAQLRVSGRALVEQRGLEPRPSDIAVLLGELELSKYLGVFEEQDVDLQVFLTLTDADLQQIGIKLFGPRRKMTNAIARWHSNARLTGHGLEQAYADKLETEMQEMAIRLHQACEQLERVKLQLLQEHELRAVTEACLMEDREMWTQVVALATDTLHRCSAMRELIDVINRCGEELGRRCPPGLPPPLRTPSLASSGGANSLTAALLEGLSLGGMSQGHDPPGGPGNGPPEDSSTRMATQQLVARFSHAKDELVRLLTLVFVNTDRLLKKQYNTAALPPGPHR